MNAKVKKDHRYVYLLLALIIFYAVNNYLWIKLDCNSMEYDVSNHIRNAIAIRHQLRNILQSDDNLWLKLKAIYNFRREPSITWPRLVHLFSVLLAIPFKDFLFSIRYSNIVYFFILIGSIYLLGARMYTSFTGILAASLISFYPGIFGLSRKFGLDFPLISMVSLTAYFLFCCKGFQNRIFSLLFGFSLGITSLIKGQAIFSIIGPLVFVAITGLKNNTRKTDYFLNLFLAAIIAYLISLIWWYRIFSKEGLENIHFHFLSRSPYSEFQGGSILEESIFYLKQIYLNISPIFFFLFLGGLFLCIKHSKDEGFIFLMLWLIVPYIIFSLILAKADRYIFPTFGAISLITAYGLSNISFPKYAKQVVIFLMFLLGLLQFFLISYLDKRIFNEKVSVWAHAPEINNHQIIMRKFYKTLKNLGSSKLNIAIIETDYFKGDDAVRLAYLLENMNDKISIRQSLWVNNRTSYLQEEFLKNWENYNFLIAFSWDYENPDFDKLLDSADSSQKKFIKQAIKKFKSFRIKEKDILFPNGSNIFLLEKIK